MACLLVLCAASRAHLHGSSVSLYLSPDKKAADAEFKRNSLAVPRNAVGAATALFFAVSRGYDLHPDLLPS